MGSYLRPSDLSEALSALSHGGLAVIAGGTDFYPARVDRAVPEDVLDISGLSELRRIKIMPRYVRIGAGVTWSDLIHADLPCSFNGLKLAARKEMGFWDVLLFNIATVLGPRWVAAARCPLGNSSLAIGKPSAAPMNW